MVVLLLLLALCCEPGLGSNQKRPMWYHSYPDNWDNARGICQSLNQGDLLTVLSQDELDFMDLRSYHAWIGLTRHNDHYHWDGADTDHAPDHWVAGPDYDCGLTSYEQDSPESDNCHHKHFFFCNGLFSDVFVPQTKSYDNSKQFCESLSRDLSTFSGKSGLQFQGSPLYDPQEFPVWIGLRSDGVSWSWGDGRPSDFRNWAPDLGSAPGPGSGDCVSVSSLSKSMSVHDCSDAYPFVCYNPNLVLLQELMPWEQALEHCKTLSSAESFRLLSLNQNHMETIENVLRFAQTNRVWVGLRYLAGAWFWSDGSTLPLPGLSCPDFTLGCGALVLSSGSDPVIEPVDCSEKLNFLCYNPALYA